MFDFLHESLVLDVYKALQILRQTYSTFLAIVQWQEHMISPHNNDDVIMHVLLCNGFSC